MNDRARNRHEVVVTGMGIMTAGGVSVSSTWDYLLSGQSAAVGVEELADGLPTSFACIVSGYDEAEVPPHERRKMDRVTRLAMGATAQALAAAGFDDAGAVAPERVAVVMGVGVGGLTTMERESSALWERGFGAVSPFTVPKMMANAPAAAVAIEYGFCGPCLTVSTACASGAHAIGEAAELIRRGAVDVVIAGGAEAIVTRTALALFGRMSALSTRNDAPERASRPFDADRDGFVLADGAAVLVLERSDHARVRNAPVYGTVLGYAANSDAYHVVAPSLDGKGAVRCMLTALQDADVSPLEVPHVNAHGTSTLANDINEAVAISAVFGDTAPSVTSCKGALGHSIGAAGAVEAVAAILSSSYGTAPPTANCDNIGPGIAVDVVQRVPRPLRAGSPVLSNSFGFGGHNACLVLAGTEAPKAECRIGDGTGAS